MARVHAAGKTASKIDFVINTASRAP